MLLTFTSCEVVEGIFKLGMGVGVFIVIAILAVIIYVFAKLRKK
jgi:Na+-transporting methylmalonyl-CoA/oxaloacetate decarboxylase gamma subunit